MKTPSPHINPQFAISLFAAYNAKAADTERSKTKARSRAPETRMILILSVFDDRSAKWTYELLVEQGVLDEETDPKRKINQLRKVSGWIAEIRVQDMKLPPQCKGLVQPPDMAVARQRWEVLNPRPSMDMILSGEWEGIAANYSDLNLSASQQGGRKKVTKNKGAKSNKASKVLPSTAAISATSYISPPVKRVKAANEAEPSASEQQEDTPMNQKMQRIAEEIDQGGAVVIPRKRKRPHVSLPNAFKS